MYDERVPITAFVRGNDGSLIVKLEGKIDPLGKGSRVVLRIPSELVLDRGNVIELKWEKESGLTTN